MIGVGGERHCTVCPVHCCLLSTCRLALLGGSETVNKNAIPRYSNPWESHHCSLLVHGICGTTSSRPRPEPTQCGGSQPSCNHEAMIAMPWRVLSTCLLIVSSLGFVPGTQAESASPGARSKDSDDSSVRPNVLVVVVDDLGWKDVGFHDASFSTPNMDIMVAEGVELSTFYAAATCTPSRAQLMTGRYSYRIGMQDSVLHSTEPRGVPLTETFVGERLQTAGYTTAAVGKWHLGMHMPQYLPKERGFDEFYGILTGGGGHYEHMSVSMEFSPRGAVGMPRTFAGPNIVDGNELSEDNKKESMSSHLHTTELYTRKAAEFLETMSAKDDPWFLYLSYQVSE